MNLDPLSEARGLVELLDETCNRGDVLRLREIVSRPPSVMRRGEVRDLAEVVMALDALRDRIWIYRVARQLQAAAEQDDVDTAPLRE